MDGVSSAFSVASALFLCVVGQICWCLPACFVSGIMQSWHKAAAAAGSCHRMSDMNVPMKCTSNVPMKVASLGIRSTKDKPPQFHATVKSLDILMNIFMKLNSSERKFCHLK